LNHLHDPHPQSEHTLLMPGQVFCVFPRFIIDC
jgi:hypothetical protein